MGLFDRWKKQPESPSRPDAPADVTAEIPAAETGAPQTATLSEVREPELPEPETPERHVQVTEEVGAPVLTGTPGRRFVSDPEQRFNLDDTNLVAQAMEIPREQRDIRWLEAFQLAAWNASVVLPKEPVFLGPDGMPYVRLELPPVGEAVEMNCLSNLYVSMAEQGLGAAFFKSNTDAPEAAEYVMPTGVLESLRAYGTWDGDPEDIAELIAQQQAGQTAETERQVMVGSPSANYLPKHTARMLYRHLTEGWKMEDPRIALVVDPQMTPTRNLVIGRKLSDFPNAEVAAQAARMLLWYLPPRRYLLLMPDDWSVDQMRPLRELC